MAAIIGNVLLGIIGGVISSVIVSKIFSIEADYSEEFAKVEKYITNLEYLRGNMDANMEIQEKMYDYQKQLDKSKMSDGEILCFEEIEEYMYSGCIKSICERAQNMKDEMFLSYVKDLKLNDVRNSIEKILDEIIKLEHFSFEEFKNCQNKMKMIRCEFCKCRKNKWKVILKKVLKDKLMICLYVLIIALVVAYGITKVNGI